jgi:hypothetical protein
MIILIAAILTTTLLLVVLMLTRRTLVLHRSVLLHAPVPAVWQRIEDFPGLLAEHGRGRTLGAFSRHSFVKGDPYSSGSAWRTRGIWAGSEYWVDGELVRVEAGRRIVIRLLRDSLQTHHGLRGHVARLTLQPNGPGTCKLTWELQARFRPTRLLWHRHCDRVRLQARLLDICLRSVKVDIDSGNHDDDAGVTTRTADGEAPAAGPVVPSPHVAERGAPRLHPD